MEPARPSIRLVVVCGMEGVVGVGGCCAAARGLVLCVSLSAVDSLLLVVVVLVVVGAGVMVAARAHGAIKAPVFGCKRHVP